MARVTGPLMSMSASGTIANTLTFATTRGIPVVRSYAVPSNPNSFPQRVARAVMRYAGEQWVAFDNATKALWADAAANSGIPGINYYQRQVMAWNSDGMGLAKNPDRSGSGATSMATTWTATAARKSIVLTLVYTNPANVYATKITIVPTDGGTTTLIYYATGGNKTVTIPDLQTGVDYTFNAYAVSKNGTIAPSLGAVNATPT